MPTPSPQDRASRKKKGQRALVLPALPLNVKPKQQVTSELPSASPASTKVPSIPQAVTSTQAVGGVLTSAQDVEISRDETSHQRSQAYRDHTSTAVAEFQSTVKQSPTAPDEPAQVTRSPTAESTTGSQSATPKASSRAGLSSTQSPAPELAATEPHLNGITTEGLQNGLNHFHTRKLYNNEAAADGSQQTAESINTHKPRRYFSSEEPILDWAEEMSEEMPPDTLHVPSVPHLPELSSEPGAARTEIASSVPYHTSQQPSTRPVFGAAAAQELLSDDIDTASPIVDRTHLTNGYSYTPDSATGIFDSPTRSYDMKGVDSRVNGHGAYGSQIPSDSAAVTDIANHIATLFDTRQWADWTIQVASTNASYPPVAYHAHSAVISRSATLRTQMQKASFASPMSHMIILSPPRYVQPSAFEAALKYLYNDLPLTSADCSQFFPFDSADTAGAFKTYRLEFCFSYWLSGLYLGIPQVSESGSDLLKEFVDWDTVALLAGAYLDVKKTISALQPLSPIDGPTDAPSTPSRRSDTFIGQPHLINGLNNLKIMDVIAEVVTSGKLVSDLGTFKLDTRPSKLLKSYLPDLQQSNKHSNPALASITFGSLPSTSLSEAKTQGAASQPVLFSSNPPDTNASFSSAEQALSVILLNVPFAELSQLFKGLMESFPELDVLKLFADVIDEREQRRSRVAVSPWYQSEVVSNRRLYQVEYSECLVRNGQQSHLSQRIKDERS